MVLFVRVFSLTGRTLCGVRVLTSHAAVGGLAALSLGGSGQAKESSFFGGPPCRQEVGGGRLPQHFSASGGCCSPSARCGDRGAAVPTRAGERGKGDSRWLVFFTEGAGCQG